MTPVRSRSWVAVVLSLASCLVGAPSAASAPIFLQPDDSGETGSVKLVYGDGVSQIAPVITTSAGPYSYLVRITITDAVSAPTAPSPAESTHCTPIEGGFTCDVDAYYTAPRVVGSPLADVITVRSTTADALGVRVAPNGGDDIVDASSIANGGVTIETASDEGNDTYYLGRGNPAETLAASPGVDTISFERASARVNLKEAKFAAEVLVGSSFDDTIMGAFQQVRAGAGNDTISMPSLDATIDAGAGSDEIRDESFDAKRRNQRIIGGPGEDTYFIDSHAPRATICLDDRARICGRWDGRPGERDDIRSDVEDVLVAGSDPVVLVGSAKANWFSGGGGDDVFVGGGGADTFIGETGFDVVSYEVLQPRGISATFDGRRNDGSPRHDLIRNDMEGVVGTRWRDVLTGSARSESLNGMAGNDVLDGKGGRDYLSGGAGNDTITARDGAGGDVVVCGPGRDVVRADATDRVAKDCEQSTETKANGMLVG